VLVTFDDGYKDNLENALPVLQRTGMRAVVFVSTSYVSERRLFWWERVYVLLSRARRQVAKLEYPTPLELDLRGPRPRALAQAARQVTRIVKDVFDLDLERFLTELGQALDAPWSQSDERAYADRVIMRWDEVEAAQRAGMDVQSHTCTHRVLQTLPDAALDTELGSSRAELLQRIRRPMSSIAYPVGHSIAREPRVRSALTRAGYALGFTTNPGVNLLSPRTDRFDLDRIPVDRGTPDNFFQGMVTLPWLAR
jgi:peptidoglycan/xylan/chitin deacetylase (PgdA/CDA1 family)